MWKRFLHILSQISQFYQTQVYMGSQKKSSSAASFSVPQYKKHQFYFSVHQYKKTNYIFMSPNTKNTNFIFLSLIKS